MDAEWISFPGYGEYLVHQVSRTTQNQKCLSNNSIVSDSTGLRTYTGSYVMLNLLSKLSESFCSTNLESKYCVELGSGTGIVSLLSCSKFNYTNLVLTDGNNESIEICKLNIASILKDKDKTKIAEAKVLYWEEDKVMDGFLREVNAGSPFQLVLGCELMYYRSNVKALLSTVLSLTGNNNLEREEDCNDSIFVHCHLFRGENQEREIINYLKSNFWSTLLIPIKSFVSAEEIKVDPTWLNVKCLISARKSKIDALLDGNKEWIHFETFMKREEEEEEDTFSLLSKVSI